MGCHMLYVRRFRTSVYWLYSSVYLFHIGFYRLYTGFYSFYVGCYMLYRGVIRFLCVLYGFYIGCYMFFTARVLIYGGFLVQSFSTRVSPNKILKN